MTASPQRFRLVGGLTTCSELSAILTTKKCTLVFLHNNIEKEKNQFVCYEVV